VNSSIPLAKKLFKLLHRLEEEDKEEKPNMDVIEATKKKALAIIQSGKANLNFQEEDGNTALTLATDIGYVNIARELLKQKVDVNIADEEGYTALMNAFIHGYEDIVRMLLDVPGIDVMAKNNRGRTALSFCRKDMTEFRKILRSRGAKEAPSKIIHTGFPRTSASAGLNSYQSRVSQTLFRKSLYLPSVVGGKRSQTQRKRKDKCRLVVGKRETCCIRPKKGHWCWSKGTKRRISRKMKRNCCR
jgi:hypothetical protein